MDKIFVKGGNKLFGSIKIPASKNAYLPILAGSILCEGKVILHNFPDFSDVKNMITILENLGAKTIIQNKTLIIDLNSLAKFEIPSNFSSSTRASIFCLGALLGRFQKAKVAYPGGCDIGSRPIDLHLKGLKALNVQIIDRRGYISCNGTNMRGANIHLDFPSVGATENIMMAAVKAKGTTKIVNAAKEPEIVDLQNFLNKAGAKVFGAGTDCITIYGVKKLHSVCHTPISDRIITGTYLLAGTMCGGEIELKNTSFKNIGALIAKLEENGCKIWKKQNKIVLKSNGICKAIPKLETMPFPGFPTDLQPQTTAMLSTAQGTSVVVENLFETRFKFVHELTKMGANIVINDRSAIITGVPKLYGSEVCANDLRGGAGLVLAGLVADGRTTIDGVKHIDRGYEHIEKDLSILGANIKRLTT